MKLSVIANPSKYEVREVLAKTIEWAERKNITLFIESEICKQTELNDSEIIHKTDSDEESIERSDFVLVMGGDFRAETRFMTFFCSSIR